MEPTAEKVGHRGEAADGLGTAHLPAAARVGERPAGSDAGHVEHPDARHVCGLHFGCVVGDAVVLAGPHARLDRHLHVRLSGCHPDLADEHVPAAGGATGGGDRQFVRSARRLRRQRRLPRRAGRQRPKRLPAELDGDLLPVGAGAPDADRPVPLDHGVIAPDRVGGEGDRPLDIGRGRGEHQDLVGPGIRPPMRREKGDRQPRRFDRCKRHPLGSGTLLELAPCHRFRPPLGTDFILPKRLAFSPGTAADVDHLGDGRRLRPRERDLGLPLGRVADHGPRAELAEHRVRPTDPSIGHGRGGQMGLLAGGRDRGGGREIDGGGPERSGRRRAGQCPEGDHSCQPHGAVRHQCSRATHAYPSPRVASRAEAGGGKLSRADENTPWLGCPVPADPVPRRRG